MSSPVACSPRSLIWATSFANTSALIQNQLGRSAGPTPTPAAESSLTKSPGHLTSGLYCFLGGLGAGPAVGILFAPDSGTGTRDRIRRKADEAGDLVTANTRKASFV